MDDTLRAQIDTDLSHLDGLIKRGHQLQGKLQTNPADAACTTATRHWQEECGVTINQLSGGSKAHWLARSFSEAFLKRSPEGRAAQGATPAEIVQQLLAVLGQAVASLSGSEDSAIVSASTEAPAPRHFEFVHNAELRPVLESAYADSRSALNQGDNDLALMTCCGILESIVTDALENKGLTALLGTGAPANKISEWSFDTRLTVAEKAGLIHSGCARLPAVARAYRDRMNTQSEGIPQGTISQSDARRTSQVLHVIMRDLDPGR